MMANQIEIGQKYKSTFGDDTLYTRLRKDGNIGSGQLDDGSIIVPENEINTHITQILRKEGKTQRDIDDAISKFLDTPADGLVQITQDTIVRKWEDVPAQPHLDGTVISPLVPLKTAYEFVAVFIEKSVYDDHPDLEFIKNTLRSQDQATASNIIDQFVAGPYKAFHGICFEGNNPTATVQVRLFGRIAYRIRFPRSQLMLTKTTYTYDLKTDEHSIEYGK